MQIDLANYQEKCHECGQPARTELCTDERIGVEWFQFCINPKCIQYDASIIRDREQEENKARQSAAFKRHQDRLWAKEISAMHRTQRKRRRMLASLGLGKSLTAHT